MAIKNTAAVYIDGINRTSHVVTPIKWGNFLDERLDEMHLTLKPIKKEIFPPLTPVEIRLKNELYWHDDQTVAQKEEQTKYFIVANDIADESPVGSGLYSHDLYLIELTKYLECVVVDTITFTNDLGRNYEENFLSETVTPKLYENSMLNSSNVRENTQTTHSIHLYNREGDVYIPSFSELNGYRWVDDDNYGSGTPGTSTSYDVRGRIFVYRESGYNERKEFKSESIVEPSGTAIAVGMLGGDATDTLNGITVKLTPGNYIVEYTYLLEEVQIYAVYDSYSGEYEIVNMSTRIIGAFCCKYSIFVYDKAENFKPLKKWTITDVINRTLDLAEPLKKGEVPRFKLNEAQAKTFDNIISPQFTFTTQTLRECLQQIGQVIHGEPRINLVKDSNGKYYFEISYDLYAGTEKSNVKVLPYIRKDVSQVINSYASWIDSNAENLVNQLDRLGGVIVEPLQEGCKTVRTEAMYTRITDTNMIISTQFPIYSVEKLEYVEGEKSYNITPWLFEKTVYDTQLSSYDGAYPTSKAYGIYYSQGEKNICGLNFKEDAPLFPAFENYAIVNIIRQAKCDYNFSVSNYSELCFRITYSPFYNSRIAQAKSNYEEFNKPCALVYNQQANIIETKYYGENVKGVIARLGTVEKSLTYNLSRLSHIPKAGQLFDKDYYICAVSVEFLPTIIKCTIGLSKDFNRLSQYISINSEKRFSEVSRKQAVERNTLWREFIVIGNNQTPDNDSLMGESVFSALAGIFDDKHFAAPISCVIAWGESMYGNPITVVTLPVISSAFGNSISFSWAYKDNYSAGEKSVYATNNNVNGYFQNDVPYSDYYGKIYYYNFDLSYNSGKGGTTALNYPQYGDAGDIPTINSGVVSTVRKSPYLLRKDNREILQCNFQIDFVTNNSSLIIGSGLAEHCPLIRDRRGFNYNTKLYVLDRTLDKFADRIVAEGITDLSKLPSISLQVENLTDKGFMLSAENFPGAGKAWAIITELNTESNEVEDFTGKTVTQNEYAGGVILLAQNIDIKKGDEFTPIYFTAKSQIYDLTVWKDAR